MAPPPQRLCLVLSIGCLISTATAAETKPPRRQAATRKAPAKRAAVTGSKASRSGPTSRSALLTERQSLDRKIQEIDARLTSDPEVAANRKVLTEVIRKKAERQHPEYAKLLVDLSEARKKVKDLQARIARINATIVKEPAVTRLDEQVKKLMVEKGNALNPNYGAWVARRDELNRQIAATVGGTSRGKPGQARPGSNRAGPPSKGPTSRKAANAT